MRRQPGEDGKVGVRLRGAGLEAVVEAVAGEVRVRGRGVEGCEGRGDVWLAVEVGEEGGGGGWLCWSDVRMTVDSTGDVGKPS